MAKRKNSEEPMHENVSAEFIEEEFIDVPEETEETNENNYNEETDITTDEKTGIFIKLVRGGSFTSGQYSFEKNVTASVGIEDAEKFMKTGFFERV